MSLLYELFKIGYDKDGYDRNGFSRFGYDRYGYDKDGYGADGCDINGFNKSGYDRRGYNKKGYGKDGYDRNGFNMLGNDRSGYDKEGYGKDGYNRNGFNKLGYDRSGSDKEGYGKDGYNRNGFNKLGYDRNGSDKEGYGKDGYNRNGFNKLGYDRSGYDKEEYGKDGYDRNGFNSLGYDRSGYDKEGFEKDGYDRNGFNKLGYDRSGYNKEGYEKDGYDRNGYDKEGYDKYGHSCNEEIFISALEKYKLKEKGSEIYLAACYLKGIGIKRDIAKAFSLIVEGAYNNSSTCLKLLGDCYYCGDGVSQNIALAQFIYNLAEGKNPPVINQYKAMAPTTFKAKNKKTESENETVHSLEESHLRVVVSSIERNIKDLESQILNIETETWWMNQEQRNDWMLDKHRNIGIRQEIFNLSQTKARPYYARMDSMCSDSIQTHYIGEESYTDYMQPEANIVSVWSEYGRRYRDLNKNSYIINGSFYKVVLRRRFNIVNSTLIEVFEDYAHESSAAEAQITDPYLVKVLEEKKGETNITNIIRSIQLNQNNIIEYDFNKNIIVQGCAGSGKTMILLHRLANMKYNLPNLDLTKIKIITPNNQFTYLLMNCLKIWALIKLKKLR